MPQAIPIRVQSGNDWQRHTFLYVYVYIYIYISELTIAMATSPFSRSTSVNHLPLLENWIKLAMQEVRSTTMYQSIIYLRSETPGTLWPPYSCSKDVVIKGKPRDMCFGWKKWYQLPANQFKVGPQPFCIILNHIRSMIFKYVPYVKWLGVRSFFCWFCVCETVEGGEMSPFWKQLAMDEGGRWAASSSCWYMGVAPSGQKTISCCSCKSCNVRGLDLQLGPPFSYRALKNIHAVRVILELFCARLAMKLMRSRWEQSFAVWCPFSNQSLWKAEFTRQGFYMAVDSMGQTYFHWFSSNGQLIPNCWAQNHQLTIGKFLHIFLG